MITFQEIHQFMTEPVMLYTLIAIFGIGILLFIIFGAVLGTKKKPIIIQKNFRRLMSVIIIMGMLLVFLVYPFHLFLFTDQIMDAEIKKKIWDFVIIQVVLLVFLILLNIKYKK